MTEPGMVKCQHCDGTGKVKCDCPSYEMKTVEGHPLNHEDWRHEHSSQGYVVRQCRRCKRVFGIRHQWDAGTGSDDDVKDFGIGDPLVLVTERHY